VHRLLHLCLLQDAVPAPVATSAPSTLDDKPRRCRRSAADVTAPPRACKHQPSAERRVKLARLLLAEPWARHWLRLWRHQASANGATALLVVFVRELVCTPRPTWPHPLPWVRCVLGSCGQTAPRHVPSHHHSLDIACLLRLHVNTLPVPPKSNYPLRSPTLRLGSGSGLCPAVSASAPLDSPYSPRSQHSCCDYPSPYPFPCPNSMVVGAVVLC
jgi:hypothetical protein